MSLTQAAKDARADRNTLKLGVSLIAVAPVFAATDIVLVATKRKNLNDPLSHGLWAGAFACGLAGTYLVGGVLSRLIDDVEKLRSQ